MLTVAAILAVGLTAPQPTPAPCPGMGGLEIGQTRLFSFGRMAKLEPDKAKVTRDVKVVHRPAGRPWIITVVYDSDAADAKVSALYYLLEPPVPGLAASLAERYGEGTPVPMSATQKSWELPRCGVRVKYSLGLNEKQQPIEELWVDRLQPVQASQVEEEPAEGEATAFFAAKHELYRRTAADLALQGGSSNEDRARVLLVELATMQMNDLVRLCRYIEAKGRRPVSLSFFGDRLVPLVEKREEKMLQHGAYLEWTRAHLKEAQSLSDVIDSEIHLRYSEQRQSR
jgi:hypothetical protein